MAKKYKTRLVMVLLDSDWGIHKYGDSDDVLHENENDIDKNDEADPDDKSDG